MKSTINKKNMLNCWLKAEILPLEMMSELRNIIRSNESFNANAGNHGAISQDTDDADNMELSSDKEATIAASNIASSEGGGTQT